METSLIRGREGNIQITAIESDSCQERFEPINDAKTLFNPGKALTRNEVPGQSETSPLMVAVCSSNTVRYYQKM
jgi:hypothetical protein